MTYMDHEQETQAFARRAAAHFAKEPGHYTYTDGEIQAGELFAMRYGLGDDCVVVFRIDGAFTPTNYQELVREYQADAI